MLKGMAFKMQMGGFGGAEIDWYCIYPVRCGAERGRYRWQLEEEKVRGLADYLFV